MFGSSPLGPFGDFPSPVILRTPTWVPTDLGASVLKGYWDFENNANITTVSGDISAMNDSIAAGVQVTQGTASARPALVTSSVTGRQVGRFAGDDFLAANPITVPAAYPITGNFEWWFVGTQDAPLTEANARYVMAAGNTTTTGFYMGMRDTNTFKGKGYAITNGVVVLGPGPDDPAGTPYLFSGRKVLNVKVVSNVVTVGLDNVNGTPVAATPPGTNTRFRIGCGAASATANFWIGDISALLLISGTLTAADVNNLLVWAGRRLGF